MTFWDWPRQLLGMAPRGPVTGHPEPELVDLEIDAEGWLSGRHVELVPSVRHSPLTSKAPIAIVWHYTATDIGTAANLAKRIRKAPGKKDRKASWTVLVGVDGTIYQSVPFLRGSWHCAKGTIGGHRVNACSVGVELEGHGHFFPMAQRDAAELLVRALVETYDIPLAQAGRGHREFDPKRRSDPGPVWEALLPGLLDRAYR